jgi:hypothetical protein
MELDLCPRDLPAVELVLLRPLYHYRSQVGDSEKQSSPVFLSRVSDGNVKTKPLWNVGGIHLSGS